MVRSAGRGLPRKIIRLGKAPSRRALKELDVNCWRPLGTIGHQTMRCIKLFLLGVAWCATIQVVVFAETIQNNEYGYKITIPDGFVAKRNPNLPARMQYFELPAQVEGPPSLTIMISSMGCTIPEGKLDLDEMLDMGIDSRVESEPWREFQIQLARVPRVENGAMVLTLLAYVPLEPSAITIGVGGLSSKEAELRTLMRTLLASVEGETSWGKTRRYAFERGRELALVGFGVIAYYLYKRGKRPQRQPVTAEGDNTVITKHAE